MNAGTALLIGLGLGLASFGGLWLTVRGLPTGKAGIWLAVSAVVRLGLVGVTFYGLSREGPGLVLAGLAGLWLGRWWVVRQVGGHGHGR
jgi:F1F0 ATPase subunit 2